MLRMFSKNDKNSAQDINVIVEYRHEYKNDSGESGRENIWELCLSEKDLETNYNSTNKLVNKISDLTTTSLLIKINGKIKETSVSEKFTTLDSYKAFLDEHFPTKQSTPKLSN